jgi:hypothetical protein
VIAINELVDEFNDAVACINGTNSVICAEDDTIPAAPGEDTTIVVAVIEPLMSTEPDNIKGIFVLFYCFYTILITIKFPFLYNPPNGTPPAAAAVSSTKFKLCETC